MFYWYFEPRGARGCYHRDLRRRGKYYKGEGGRYIGEVLEQTPECPECGASGPDIIKAGKKLTRKGPTQRYQCKVCARLFVLQDPRQEATEE